MAEFEDFESFTATMTRDEIFEWFQKRLNRPPEAFDIYKVAKEFYQLGAYSRSRFPELLFRGGIYWLIAI